MEFTFSDYKVKVDIKKTRNYYCNADLVSDGCSCNGCRNYVAAVSVLDPRINLFFDRFGIDMRKIYEVYVNCAYSDGTLFYGGFYHLCGELIEGESAWINVTEKLARWDTGKTYAVTDDFMVSFQTECSLLADDFPRPVIQMDIEARIPWVLLEDHDYPVVTDD